MNKVDNILNSLVEKNKTPSVQYIVFDKDSVIHRFQKGFADIKSKKEVDENTTFSAFSMTKTFTALAILQLAEKGKLDIDDTISQYLTDFPYPDNITIRQLMTHSAGIPNPNPLSWIHLIREHQTFDRNNFFKPIFNKNNKVKSKPNDKFSYSNLGYILLGQLIESVSGMTYENYIIESILKKLNLHSNELAFTNNPVQHAKGYHKHLSFSNWILGFFIDNSKYRDKKEGKWEPFKNLYINGTAYGGLFGTPNAFMKYIQELLKPNCQLLKEEYKKMLFTENYTNDNKATGMCLAWFKGQLNGNQYFHHAGGGGGYYCEIRIYPHLEIGSVIMFNRSGMSDERFLDKIDKYYIQI